MPTNGISEDLRVQRPMQLIQSSLRSFLVPVLARDVQGSHPDDETDSDHSTDSGVPDPPSACVSTGSLQEEEEEDSTSIAPRKQHRPKSLAQ